MIDIILRRAATTVLVVAVSGCVAPRVSETVTVVTQQVMENQTDVKDAAGSKRANAFLTQEDEGVRVLIAATGMKPGTYGAHIHMTGRCDKPDFVSAGPHWNPMERLHGRDNPAGAHLGDLPNLVVAADGRGILDAVIANAQLSEGTRPIIDADGAAIVIHASPDDYRTDPSGNSGARVACGVWNLAK